MVQIKTKRLVIREFKPNDWKDVHDYASDPIVTNYVFFGPNEIKETKAFVLEAINERKKKNRDNYGFAITVKGDDKVIGGCSIVIKDRLNREAAIGFMLHRNHWNKGYISEAVKALINFGFKELKLHRLTATCRPANLASKRVMEKAGMKREAHFKKHIFYQGKWHDSLLFAILEDERKILNY